MKRLITSVVLCALLGVSPGTAEGVMVDFESPTYTAGTSFDGVDGWAHWGAFAGTTSITPDNFISGDQTVLSGAQSARLWGTPENSIMYRLFDEGPTAWDTGSIVSGRMLMSGPGGSVEFFVSQSPATASTPGGVVANVGGNFVLFGNGPDGYYYDTGVPSFSDTDYLVEMEMDLDAQTFQAYATPSGGSRTDLGSLPFIGTIKKGGYAQTGFILVARAGAVGVYDDLDVFVVEPPPLPPLLPEPIDFEDDVYVAGNSVVGVDGWMPAVWVADGTITNTTVLEGTKSLRLTGSPNAILQRNLGEGTTIDDGSIVSAIMMADGPVDSTAEFFYSHNQSMLATPAGILGKVGGNFWIFGQLDGEIVSPQGIETTVPFESNVEYLLELEIDFTSLRFNSYVTDLTNAGTRTLLGEAELWFTEEASGVPAPSDGTNAGYIVVTRGEAVAYYDSFNCVAGSQPPELPGDLNGDGLVGSADLDIVRGNWGQSVEAGCLSCGDPSGDGLVGSADLDIVRANWGATAAAAVPEPGGLVLLVIGMVLAASARRQW